MKVAFILRDLSDEFFAGSAYIQGLDNLSDEEKFERLQKVGRDLPKNIQMKIGRGTFSDRVTLNSLLKRGEYAVSYKLEPRRGYRLATFEFSI